MNQENFLAACTNAIAKAKRIAPETVSINMSDPFSLYGLDSLDVMNFLLELEQGTNLDLSDVDPGECNTIGRLYSFLREQKQV